MSKFTAIEARATQYPASANDVVWLVARVRELRDALEEAITDPRPEDGITHTQARKALAALDEPNLPVG